MIKLRHIVTQIVLKDMDFRFFFENKARSTSNVWNLLKSSKEKTRKNGKGRVVLLKPFVGLVIKVWLNFAQIVCKRERDYSFES